MTTNSRRSRKRTLIAVTAVLTVLFVCWRLGSSGVDQRFVGKWDDMHGPAWHFNADGSFQLVSGGDVLFANQQWWVSGNRIVIYTPRRSWSTDARNWLTYMARRLAGKKAWNLSFEDYPVTKFTGDTLQLDYGLDLRRVPERPSPR